MTEYNACCLRLTRPDSDGRFTKKKQKWGFHHCCHVIILRFEQLRHS